MLNLKFIASNRHYKEIDLASKCNCSFMHATVWQIQFLRTMTKIDSVRSVDGTV